MEGFISSNRRSSGGEKKELFHIIHKVPAGDSPYVRAKHLQKCGMVEEHIELLKQKLRMIYHGEAFNGKIAKTARSHGKRFQVSIKQETVRVLGNLGWAYIQQNNFAAAEAVYRKAQKIEPDANKACNLGICLMRQGNFDDARCVLLDIVNHRFPSCEERKVNNRAMELLCEIKSLQSRSPIVVDLRLEEKNIVRLDHVLNEWSPLRSRRLPIFEEISTYRDQMAC